MALVNLNKRLTFPYRGYRRKKVEDGRILRILVILAVATMIPSFLIFSGLTETVTQGKALAAAYQNQNFDEIKKKVSDTKNSLQKVDLSLNLLFWVRIIPILGGYYSDLKGFSSAGVEELIAFEKILNKLEPVKEELGFNNSPRSGPDRMSQAVKILEKSLSYLDEVSPNLEKAAGFVEGIDTEKYPQNFRQFQVRKVLATVKNFIIGSSAAVSEGKDALMVAPQALGMGGQRNYLMLFQNDKEIRPTGGFLTAYATLTMDQGRIDTTTSDDIYRLDEKLLAICLSKICPLTPPEAIVKYLPEVDGKSRKAWSMRDSNISPDLPTSAKEFERMYQLLGEGLPFDGIIYIDSQVVEELIEVTGPIDVLGTTYSSEIDKRCNCPNVIYELESYAEIAAKGEQGRKAILGVLMQQILARSLGADVEKIPQLLETVTRLANHKHIMFYMHDSSLQNALSKLNWTGEIKEFDGDFLHINDSNFAGGKTNIYIEQEVTQEISVQKDGTVKKKITIEYKNPQAFNTWLNGINRDYVRFYVPKGSKLLSSKGSEVPVTEVADLDKTVFEAFIQVRPQNLRKLEIEYEIPDKISGEYKLLIQKQPGAKDFHYIIKLNNSQKADFALDQDREFKFDL
ncbi:DUF4012 domain-containing protein [Candidatus Daviesbacteria bacterium]|nr:DUF4012 domain-containing protein [Candidatus Daviesbacteria bacterium]